MLLLLLACGASSDVFRITDSGFATSDCWLESGLPAAFETGLVLDGCGYQITGFNEAETLKLSFDVPVFADLLTSGSADTTYTLPDDAVRFSVVAGCRMKRGWCDQRGTASEVYTYTPIGGSVTVTGTGLDAHVAMTGVSLAEAEYGYSAAMGDVAWDVTLYPTP